MRVTVWSHPYPWIGKGNRMLWNLDPTWMAIAVAIICIFSFILALGMNAVMGEDGFGPIGNTIVIAAGFLLTIFVANEWGYALRDLRVAAATGLGGSLLFLTALAIAKAALNRL